VIPHIVVAELPVIHRTIRPFKPDKTGIRKRGDGPYGYTQNNTLDIS